MKHPQVANRLLETLPSGIREFLREKMQAVALPIGTILQTPNKTLEYVHFMTSGIASVVTFMSNGSSAEVSLVGKEGLVEGMNLLGPGNSPTSAFIQVEGTALRMKYSDMQKELHASGPLMQLVLEWVQCQGYILSQLVACNALHEIEERLARWLLMVQDRLESGNFYLTHEFLAEMLGASRTTVTMVAGTLQRRGLIEYRRGNIQIIDREGLQKAACECYSVMRDLEAQLYFCLS